MKIIVKKPDQNELDAMNVKSWPVWQADPSKFPWHYDSTEVCYILEGKVTVTTDWETVTIGKGDLVTFPQGLDCEWDVVEKISKHYKFE